MAQAWRGTALISALFTLIVAVSMLIGYQRLMAEDPLQVNRLQSLREQLHKNPNDPALKHRIREADLASRQQRWPPTRSGFTPSSPLAN